MRKIPRKPLALALALLLSLCVPVSAQHALKETMDGIVTRLYDELDREALSALTHQAVLDLITEQEREILATKYWHFNVNVPVVVSVIRNVDQPVVPFWLEEAGFAKTDLTLKDTEDWLFEVWQKPFDAGPVELGINGFGKHRTVYFVCVRPQRPGADLEIANLFPAGEAVIEMQDGAWKYRDWDDLYVKDVPDALDGQRLLTTYRGRAREAHLVGAFRTTPFPAAPTPDQVTLTWSDDPRTTQSVQWRTHTGVDTGVVRYRRADAQDYLTTAAACQTIEDRLLMNDRYVHHFTAVLRGLEPATTYAYTVGSPDPDIRSEEAEFTTAPEGDAPFSFLCFADTHYTAESGQLLQAAFRQHPEVAFYLIAGDVVNTGLYRNEWDHQLEYANGVGNTKPMAFALGNHDDQDGLGAALPLALYAFPDNGPEGVEPERTFSFRYANALFLVMDVGTPHEVQAKWMAQQLAGTDATWKFAMFHFPLYSVEEDYPAIRQSWTEVFDEYHLDMAFHGHVHYYLRTKPMRDQRPVASPAEGTIYTISIAQSARTYPMPKAAYVDERFNGVAVYQKLDIDGNRLTYRAYDIDGQVRDELIIQK